MKALLKRYNGEWTCFAPAGPKPAPMGNGDTMQRAYSWWLVRCSLWGDGQGSYWAERDKLDKV